MDVTSSAPVPVVVDICSFFACCTIAPGEFEAARAIDVSLRLGKELNPVIDKSVIEDFAPDELLYGFAFNLPAILAGASLIRSGGFCISNLVGSATNVPSVTSPLGELPCQT